MENFLNVIQALSDSRFWLMPLILFCVIIIAAMEITTMVKEEINDDL